MKRLSAFLFCLSLGLSLHAKVTLPPFFSDNMVLQQKADVALWGTSDKGKKVTVAPSWTRKKYSATPDAEGKFFLRIPTPEAGGPYTISFSDGEKTVLNNVLLGEVWFCGGQSNMEMYMRGFEGQPVEHGAEYILSASPRTPIRICNLPNVKAARPQAIKKAVWKENCPEAVALTSAVAWFFASRLHQVLDVPVGLLIADWGGSAIEAWMPRELLDKEFPGEFNLVQLDTADISGLKGKDPCIHYNGMISALHPFTFKGMLWYQGENNRPRPEQYTRLQVAYVKMMRERFQNPEAPFYFVQIAPYPYGKYSRLYTNGYFNEAQQKTLELIPHSGMVTTADIGSFYTVHPPKKKEVGDRLAALALVNDYGVGGINPVAPTFESVEFNGSEAVVSFKTDKLGLSPRMTPLEGFELAGEDRVFHPATGIADMNRVTVTSPEVPSPVAVRYCFRNWCMGTLFNSYGIPAAPFRTDSWDDLRE